MHNKLKNKMSEQLSTLEKIQINQHLLNLNIRNWALIILTYILLLSKLFLFFIIFLIYSAYVIFIKGEKQKKELFLNYFDVEVKRKKKEVKKK